MEIQSILFLNVFQSSNESINNSLNGKKNELEFQKIKNKFEYYEILKNKIRLFCFILYNFSYLNLRLHQELYSNEIFLCVIILAKILLEDYSIEKAKLFYILKRFNDFSDESLLEYQIDLIKTFFKINSHEVIQNILDSNGKVLDLNMNDSIANKNINYSKNKSKSMKLNSDNSEDIVSDNSDSINNMLEEFNSTIKNKTSNKFNNNAHSHHINRSNNNNSNNLNLNNSNNSRNDSVIKCKSSINKTAKSKSKSKSSNSKENLNHKNEGSDISRSNSYIKKPTLQKIYKDESSNNEDKQGLSKEVKINNNNLQYKVNVNSNGFNAKKFDNKLYVKSQSLLLYQKQNTENMLDTKEKKDEIYKRINISLTKEEELNIDYNTKTYKNIRILNKIDYTIDQNKDFDVAKNLMSNTINSGNNNILQNNVCSQQNNYVNNLSVLDPNIAMQMQINPLNNFRNVDNNNFLKNLNVKDSIFHNHEDNANKIINCGNSDYKNTQQVETHIITHSQSSSNKIDENLNEKLGEENQYNKNYSNDNKSIKKTYDSDNLHHKEEYKNIKKCETIIVAENFLNKNISNGNYYTNQNNYNNHINSDSISEGNSKFLEFNNKQKASNLVNDNINQMTKSRENQTLKEQEKESVVNKQFMKQDTNIVRTPKNFPNIAREYISFKPCNNLTDNIQNVLNSNISNADPNNIVNSSVVNSTFIDFHDLSNVRLYKASGNNINNPRVLNINNNSTNSNNEINKNVDNYNSNSINPNMNINFYASAFANSKNLTPLSPTRINNGIKLPLILIDNNKKEENIFNSFRKNDSPTSSKDKVTNSVKEVIALNNNKNEVFSPKNNSNDANKNINNPIFNARMNEEYPSKSKINNFYTNLQNSRRNFNSDSSAQPIITKKDIIVNTNTYNEIKIKSLIQDHNELNSDENKLNAYNYNHHKENPVFKKFTMNKSKNSNNNIENEFKNKRMVNTRDLFNNMLKLNTFKNNSQGNSPISNNNNNNNRNHINTSQVGFTGELCDNTFAYSRNKRLYQSIYDINNTSNNSILSTIHNNNRNDMSEYSSFQNNFQDTNTNEDATNPVASSNTYNQYNHYSNNNININPLTYINNSNINNLVGINSNNNFNTVQSGMNNTFDESISIINSVNSGNSNTSQFSRGLNSNASHNLSTVTIINNNLNGSIISKNDALENQQTKNLENNVDNNSNNNVSNNSTIKNPKKAYNLLNESNSDNNLNKDLKIINKFNIKGFEFNNNYNNNSDKNIIVKNNPSNKVIDQNSNLAQEVLNNLKSKNPNYRAQNNPNFIDNDNANSLSDPSASFLIANQKDVHVNNKSDAKTFNNINNSFNSQQTLKSPNSITSPMNITFNNLSSDLNSNKHRSKLRDLFMMVNRQKTIEKHDEYSDNTKENFMKRFSKNIKASNNIMNTANNKNGENYFNDYMEKVNSNKNFYFNPENSETENNVNINFKDNLLENEKLLNKYNFMKKISFDPNKNQNMLNFIQDILKTYEKSQSITDIINDNNNNDYKENKNSINSNKNDNNSEKSDGAKLLESLNKESSGPKPGYLKNIKNSKKKLNKETYDFFSNYLKVLNLIDTLRLGEIKLNLLSEKDNFYLKSCINNFDKKKQIEYICLKYYYDYMHLSPEKKHEIINKKYSILRKEKRKFFKISLKIKLRETESNAGNSTKANNKPENHSDIRGGGSESPYFDNEKKIGNNCNTTPNKYSFDKTHGNSNNQSNSNFTKEEISEIENLEIYMKNLIQNNNSTEKPVLPKLKYFYKFEFIIELNEISYIANDKTRNIINNSSSHKTNKEMDSVNKNFIFTPIAQNILKFEDFISLSEKIDIFQILPFNTNINYIQSLDEFIQEIFIHHFNFSFDKNKNSYSLALFPYRTGTSEGKSYEFPFFGEKCTFDILINKIKTEKAEALTFNKSSNIGNTFFNSNNNFISKESGVIHVGYNNINILPDNSPVNHNSSNSNATQSPNSLFGKIAANVDNSNFGYFKNPIINFSPKEIFSPDNRGRGINNNISFNQKTMENYIDPIEYKSNFICMVIKQIGPPKRYIRIDMEIEDNSFVKLFSPLSANVKDFFNINETLKNETNEIFVESYFYKDKSLIMEKGAVVNILLKTQEILKFYFSNKNKNFNNTSFKTSGESSDNSSVKPSSVTTEKEIDFNEFIQEMENSHLKISIRNSLRNIDLWRIIKIKDEMKWKVDFSTIEKLMSNKIFFSIK